MGKIKNYKEHLLKSLQDPEEAAAYLDTCLEDEDPRVFLLALKDVAEARGGMSKLSAESSLNRQSLYRTLSRKGNPKLTSICSIKISHGNTKQEVIAPCVHRTEKEFKQRGLKWPPSKKSKKN